MGLRMKNFNILGVHWKIWLLRGSSWKTNIERGLPKKRGLGQFEDLRGGGGLARKRGVVPLRGVLLWCALCVFLNANKKILCTLLPQNFKIWKLLYILKLLLSIFNGMKLMIIFLLIVFSWHWHSQIGIHS